MDHTEYIERYLTGELNDQERRDFERRLSADSEFAAEYSTQVAARELVRAAGRLDRKDLLKQYEKRRSSRTTGRRLLLWSVAAVLLLILTLTWLIPTFSDAHTRLFEAYYEPYRDPVSIRGTEDTDPVREEANRLYRAGDFEAAAAQYQMISAPTFVDSFYYSISAMHGTAKSDAIIILSAIESGESGFAQIARWYLALAYVKTGEVETSKAVLRTIIESRSFRHQDAVRLLEDLP